MLRFWGGGGGGQGRVLEFGVWGLLPTLCALCSESQRKLLRMSKKSRVFFLWFRAFGSEDRKVLRGLGLRDFED